MGNGRSTSATPRARLKKAPLAISTHGIVKPSVLYLQLCLKSAVEQDPFPKISSTVPALSTYPKTVTCGGLHLFHRDWSPLRFSSISVPSSFFLCPEPLGLPPVFFFSPFLLSLLYVRFLFTSGWHGSSTSLTYSIQFPLLPSSWCAGPSPDTPSSTSGNTSSSSTELLDKVGDSQNRTDLSIVSQPSSTSRTTTPIQIQLFGCTFPFIFLVSSRYCTFSFFYFTHPFDYSSVVRHITASLSCIVTYTVSHADLSCNNNCWPFGFTSSNSSMLYDLLSLPSKTRFTSKPFRKLSLLKYIFSGSVRSHHLK